MNGSGRDHAHVIRTEATARAIRSDKHLPGLTQQCNEADAACARCYHCWDYDDDEARWPRQVLVSLGPGRVRFGKAELRLAA